ncbi:G patch domain-containing protein 4 [Drosophila takahashii]|uniref:G patch domain-containing protein 4 n=1 Tax=Drosophila takahashii TaxID=29030 RepID=UPI001CF80F8D|nr:G patch domain-containing protein 4 [Drosophila takahashii]
MDFAKKILGKYGWKEGDGLGKNNTGIAAPLKASLKFDNAGLGVDRAKEFNDHWWERCFNEAASNVDVQIGQDGKVLTARKQGEEAVEISTSGFSARKLKRAKEQHESDGRATYDNFLQTSLLTQEGGEVETSERIKVEDIEVTKVTVLTDEELFKACGGRTAHKGARHGLKLSGKIARLEQQEREMLEKLQGKLRPNPGTDSDQKSNVVSQKPEEDTVEQLEKPKKKKKARKEASLEEEAVDQLEEPLKTKKKKMDKAEKSEEVVPSEETQEEPVKIKKKKDKTKKSVEEVQEDTENQVEEPVKTKRKKDKKAEKLQEVLEATEEPVKSKKKRKNEDSTEETEIPIKNKKKKRNQEE